jgi:glycosyltransferase involved in cell wall biosynthesis
VPPTASIVIPTRGRPAYLDVALASVMPQAEEMGAEVVVVVDGSDSATDAVARARGAEIVPLVGATGVSAGRNAGARATNAELVVLIDDDISAPPGWLEAILSGARRYSQHDVFGGPIRPVLEGGGPRACGREPMPITSLDLGPSDVDAEIVWGANMAIRRRALEAVGPFDDALSGCGDEEEWLARYRATGGRIRYLAGAAVEHRRTAADATVSALARAAYARGRSARRYDVHRGAQPSTAAELRTLVGCAWHVARRQCANGIVLGAHSAGRVREALGE